jgi:hypothetical protein
MIDRRIAAYLTQVAIKYKVKRTFEDKENNKTVEYIWAAPLLIINLKFRFQ